MLRASRYFATTNFNRVATYAHGEYRNRYFSRAFGRFLQQELCADTVPFDDADPETYKRGKEIIRLFYPDMLKKDWPDTLPDY